MNFQYIKNLINDIKELASSQMIIVILLFAQVSIVTKGLGTIKYGQAALILALAAIIFRSLHAKNSDVTLLMIQKYGEKMYTRSLFFDLLIGIICYILCLIIFGSQINTFFGNYSMSFALNFFLLARISQTFSESSKAILTYNGNFKKFALVDTISNLLRFLVIVFLFNSNASIDNYLIGQATFSVTYGIFSLFICREYLIISEISLKNLAEYFTKFKSDFVKQRYDQFVGIVPQHFDLVILGYFTDFSTVGIFRIAKRLIEPINYVVSVLTPYVQNKLSRENQNIRFNKLLMNILLPTSTVLLAFYIYFGNELINLISGPSFENAYQPLLILLIGYIVYLNTFWVRQLLLFENLIHYHANSRIVLLIVFLISALFLSPPYGANGLALALSLGMISQKVYEFYSYNRLSNQK
jgi:O-antigen/teichoic acid export membrane protein